MWVSKILLNSNLLKVFEGWSRFCIEIVFWEKLIEDNKTSMFSPWNYSCFTNMVLYVIFILSFNIYILALHSSIVEWLSGITGKSTNHITNIDRARLGHTDLGRAFWISSLCVSPYLSISRLRPNVWNVSYSFSKWCMLYMV